MYFFVFLVFPLPDGVFLPIDYGLDFWQLFNNCLSPSYFYLLVYFPPLEVSFFRVFLYYCRFLFCCMESTPQVPPPPDGVFLPSDPGTTGFLE